MDFSLSEEQQLLKKTVRDFAEAEIGPHAREWDEKQEFPREVFTKLGELGLMGVVWPAEYGGSGMSTLDYAIVMEELSRVDAGRRALGGRPQQPLLRATSSWPAPRSRRRSTSRRWREGEKVGCWGLTENSAGSDAGGTKTTAVRDGDALGAERLQDLHHQRRAWPTPRWSWR